MTLSPPQFGDVSHLFTYFNANAYGPEQLIEDLPTMPNTLQEKSKSDLRYLLDSNMLYADDFYEATACKAKDEASARKFFEDVYKYAFEGGEEPDVTDYWDR